MKTAFAAIALSLTAVASTIPQAHAQTKDLTVGAIYLDAQGFYAGVRKGVQTGGAALNKNLSIIETNAQGDVSKESSFIDRLISAGVQAIVLSPVSADGSVRAIQRAHEAGIPVVCYNTCVNPAAMQKYVYAFAVGDPFTFGHDLGTAASAVLKKAGITSPKVGILNCEFVEVCVQRREGFIKALTETFPDTKIVSNQEGTILDKAITVGEQIITANPDVNVLFGESGGASLGAAKAVRNQNKVGHVFVFGGDMTTEIAQEVIRNDVIKAEVDVSGQVLGKMAITDAVDAIEKKRPETIVQAAPIVLYTTPDEAKAWIAAHADGLP